MTDKTMCKIKIGDITEEWAQGTPFGEITERHQEQYDQSILLVMENGRLRELHKRVKTDCELSFVLRIRGVARIRSQ